MSSAPGGYSRSRKEGDRELIRDVVLLGAGGHARDLVEVFTASNQDRRAWNVLGAVVDPEYGEVGSSVGGIEILGDLDWLEARTGRVEVIGAVGPSHHRRGLVARAADRGCRFCSVIHPSAVRGRRLEVAEGVVIMAGCILTGGIRLGPHVHLNVGSTVSHDVDLESFSTLSPGVHLSGNVRVEEGAFLGTGVNVVEKIEIGRWSIVGAGATVIRSVPADSTAVGCPARVIRQRRKGWHLEE